MSASTQFAVRLGTLRDEAERVMRNSDPDLRALAIASLLEDLAAVVSRLEDERAVALAQSHKREGVAYVDLAKWHKVSRTRVQQLVEKGNRLLAARA